MRNVSYLDLIKVAIGAYLLGKRCPDAFNFVWCNNHMGLVKVFHDERFLLIERHQDLFNRGVAENEQT